MSSVKLIIEKSVFCNFLCAQIFINISCIAHLFYEITIANIKFTPYFYSSFPIIFQLFHELNKRIFKISF
jgi:uncharacterized protein with PQ loop repeat